MTKKHLSLLAVIALAVVVVLLVAACGSSTTTTTAGPATTAGTTPTTVGATTTSAAATADAAALYSQYCSGCHQAVPSATADQVKAVLASGKQSMPSFSDKLSADQISAHATWVASGGQ